MSMLLNKLKEENNIGFTENGAITRKSTLSDLYDLFALGGAYRKRTDEDCILLFKNAYEENPTYALKCLFYLRNVRGGQGERRFFRVCIQWLAAKHPDVVKRNMENIPYFGRWDDLYVLHNTSCWTDAVNLIRRQMALDIDSKTPSLMAKWLKSENTSSAESRRLAKKTREALKISPRIYRKTLAMLRGKINIVETLMSQNRWDEIEFDKLPSQAGIRYKNAFARHDVTKERYEKFAKDMTTKVNASTLAPYEVVKKAVDLMKSSYGWYGSRNQVALDNVDRLMINKYWDNLTDYFNGSNFNALCMIDTSGSMTTCYNGEVAPIDVAVSLGLYCADKAPGPFAGHYISFSSEPKLIKTEGIDFCDKVDRIVRANLCENTNIKSAFDMVLNTAVKNNLPQNEMPGAIIVISDMEFDGYMYDLTDNDRMDNAETLMEKISVRWQNSGYKMPHLIFWNVNARNNNIPMKDGKNVTFISGFSASTFAQLMSGKTGYDLMMDTLNDEMYARVK